MFIQQSNGSINWSQFQHMLIQIGTSFIIQERASAIVLQQGNNSIKQKPISTFNNSIEH
jgi:hypothetical protein